MKKPFRPFRPFRPSLETITEEGISSNEVYRYITHNNLGSTKIDFNKHRENLFGPHKYTPKHSRDDPSIRYSMDRTSAGLHAFIKQQREKLQTPVKTVNKVTHSAIENGEIFMNVTYNTSSNNHYLPNNPVWRQWSSPGRVMTAEEINNDYGLRVQRWDSRQHKQNLIENSLKPTKYHTKSAVGDKTRRLSYENSSEGFRAFLKLKNKI